MALPHPSSRHWTILLVEDDEDDYILARNWLSAAKGSRFDLKWAKTLEATLTCLKNSEVDAVLVDYDLGAYSGLDVVRELARIDCHLPVIMLTGRGNYEIDLEAMQAGVTDYLPKGEVTPQLLERTIRYSIENKQREEDLREARDELERRVAERTAELTQKNEALQAEILERTRVEAEYEELQRRLINSVEVERRQLSQELHDGPMQDLYGLVYQLQAFRAGLADDDSYDVLDDMQDTVLEVIQRLRVTTGELRPPTLAPFGLEKAIRSHCEQFCKAQPDLKISLHLYPDGQVLPEDVRLALFRIYQVALTNVARHARASEVDVRLSMDAEWVELEIKDDGCGFDVPQRWLDLVRKGHYGLASATERAEAVDGHLLIESKPQAGTKVRVVVPRPLES
jgi:signal transduction histidine kinase